MEKTIKNQKPRKLSKKQKGFVADYLATGNGTQSVLKNYDVAGKKPEKTASVMAVENLAKPSIITAIEIGQVSLKSALEKQGITPARIAEKVDVLLNATEKTIVLGKEYSSPDYVAIDKGLKHATTIYGVVDEDKKSSSMNTYNFIFSKEVQEDVKKLEDNIKQKLLNHVPQN